MFIAKLVRALDSQKVNYAIVGGYAVALHGAVRGTVDVDLVLAFSKENFANAERVFISMGLESRLPVSAEQVFDFREDYIKNRNLIAWSFFNSKNPIEVVDVIISHDRKLMSVDKVMANGITFKVASISELIKMKTNTKRQQDQADIEALKRIKKR